MNENASEELVGSGPFLVDMEAMQRKISENNLKISNSTVAAFFREFPFLKNFIKEKEVNEASVSGIEDGCLKWYKRNICFSHLLSHHEEVVLLDGDGNELTRLGSVIGPRPSWWKSAPKSETVGGAINYLAKLGQAQEAKFILRINPCSGEIKLSTAPIGYSIPAWIEKQIKISSAKLKMKLEKINLEAKHL